MTAAKSSTVVSVRSAVAAYGRAPLKAVLEAIDDSGTLWVQLPDGSTVACDWLETGVAPLRVACGDRLLVWPAVGDGRGVVMGRIAPYRTTGNMSDLALESERSLTLKCGEASIDLRSDGKVMIRGEDVLVRAKRTKRIRAGTVSIN